MFTCRFEDANEYRFFCRNELGLAVDNDGGICQMDLIDCYTYNGTVFPDEMKLPIISRDYASEHGFPSYGAGIQLYTAEKNGRVLLHRPTEQRFTLSYLAGEDELQSYEMLLESNRVLWQCTCTSEQRQDLLLYLNRTYWVSDTLDTHKDHHRGEGTTQIGDHYKEAGVELDVDLPDINGKAEVRWTESGFDAQRQVLLYRGEVTYPYGTTTYVVAAGANVPTVADEALNVTLLRMAWEDHKAIRVGLAIGHDEASAIAALREGLNEYETLRDAQLREHTQHEQAAVRVATDRLPSAEAFGKATAAYLDPLMVGPTPEGRIGLRASAGKYGFFSLWDAIYPIRDLLWNRRYEEAARAVRYLFTLPAMENTPIAALHLVVQWNEALAFLPSGLLEDYYEIARKIFRFAYRLTEPQYRLLACKGNTGVDRPHQMGLSGMFLSPDVNGLWYGAARVIRNEAEKHGDAETAALADEVIRGVEAGFRRVFFDETVGYLRAGAGRDLSPAAVDVFHNSLTLGFDYPYGMHLMRELVPQLAHYQSHELWHPFGHRAVAFDSDMPCDWWKFVHMNQHNGHEMKVQRMAGDMPEVYRVMQGFLGRFERWSVAEETTNFSRFAIHPNQVCDWQTFAATGSMEALRAAVAGILRHRGGLCYLPARDDAAVTVYGVPQGEQALTVTVDGDGAFGCLVCDGVEVIGSLQVPCDVSLTEQLHIQRAAAPSYPVLLRAVDLPIGDVTVNGSRTACVCADTAYTPMVWHCTDKPQMTVNGAPASFEWDAATGTATADRLWSKGDRVEVVC